MLTIVEVRRVVVIARVAAEGRFALQPPLNNDPSYDRTESTAVRFGVAHMCHYLRDLLLDSGNDAIAELFG